LDLNRLSRLIALTLGAALLFVASAQTTSAGSTTCVNVSTSGQAVSGLDITCATKSCITVQPGLFNVRISGNTIHNCAQDGIRFIRPDTTGASYTTGVTISNNRIWAVGQTSTLGNDVTIYANSALVVDNDLTGAPNDAIDMWGDRLIFRHNTIHDIRNTFGRHNDAFQTWNGITPDDGAQGHPVTNLVIERNTIVNITGWSAHVLVGEGPRMHDWSFRNNLVRNIGSIGIILNVNGETNPPNPGIVNVTVAGNTFVDAGPNDTIEFNAGTTGVAADNIFVNCPNPYFVKTLTNVRRDYDLSWGMTPALVEKHARRADPLFVSSSNFHLRAGSRAIDSGDKGRLVPVRTTDLDGEATVGVVDRGAFESQG
jgi:hypothetical protein